MEIKINDDFDLTKIINSGQCFRGKEIEENIYRFITNDEIIYIRKRVMTHMKYLVMNVHGTKYGKIISIWKETTKK